MIKFVFVAVIAVIVSAQQKSCYIKNEQLLGNSAVGDPIRNDQIIVAGGNYTLEMDSLKWCTRNNGSNSGIQLVGLGYHLTKHMADSHIHDTSLPALEFGNMTNCTE